MRAEFGMNRLTMTTAEAREAIVRKSGPFLHDHLNHSSHY